MRHNSPTHPSSASPGCLNLQTMKNTETQGHDTDTPMAGRGVIHVPVTIGKNRMRGDSVGAMIDDGFGHDNLGNLRNILRGEASAAGVDPSNEWLTKAVQGLLKMYEEAHSAWSAAKNGCIGHVFEAALPSGQTLLMADRRVLQLLHHQSQPQG